MVHPTLRIGSIVIHCHEFERMTEFWQQALGYVPRNPPARGWVVLRDPSGKGPNLSLQTRDKQRPHRGWIHLDLYADDQEREVARLVERSILVRKLRSYTPLARPTPTRTIRT